MNEWRRSCLFFVSMTAVVLLSAVVAQPVVAAPPQGQRAKLMQSDTPTPPPTNVPKPDSKAPQGTYSATIGAPGSAEGAGSGDAAGAAKGPRITLTLSSYSSPEEIEKILNAQKAGGFEAVLPALEGFNHGTIQIGGQTYTINLTSSVVFSTNYVVSLVCSKPFATQKAPKDDAKAEATAGLVQLIVDSKGKGSGFVYDAIPMRFNMDGSVQPRSGISAAKPLKDVSLTP